MKKLIVLSLAALFASSAFSQNAPKAANAGPAKVSQDQGKDKDNGKHEGEDKEHHRHHRHHHEHKDKK